MKEETVQDFERELTTAMRPVDAPQGFAARIMDLAAENSPVSARVIPMRPRFLRPRLPLWAGAARLWTSGAIAAALLIGAFTAEQVHRRHQREEAQQQFDAAMRVTDNALDRTRSKLERSGIRLP